MSLRHRLRQSELRAHTGHERGVVRGAAVIEHLRGGHARVISELVASVRDSGVDDLGDLLRQPSPRPSSDRARRAASAREADTRRAPVRCAARGLSPPMTTFWCRSEFRNRWPERTAAHRRCLRRRRGISRPCIDQAVDSRGERGRAGLQRTPALEPCRHHLHRS
jgi:hypothetical protein